MREILTGISPVWRAIAFWTKKQDAASEQLPAESVSAGGRVRASAAAGCVRQHQQRLQCVHGRGLHALTFSAQCTGAVPERRDPAAAARCAGRTAGCGNLLYAAGWVPCCSNTHSMNFNCLSCALDSPKTSLHELLRRLHQAIPSEDEFGILSAALVDKLLQLGSPDGVSDLLDEITECLAPMARTGEDGDAVGESASSFVTRSSLLGVFVRKFLLAVNRLLFDGIARLFDDITQYTAVYQRVAGTKMTLSPVGSAVNRWKGSLKEDDDMLFSPIAASSDSTHRTFPAHSPDIPPGLNEDVPMDQSHGAVWSDDQMKFILNDTIQSIEQRLTRSGSALKQNPLSTRIQSFVSAQPSDPSVLFARYLDVLHRRDYQAALDCLHQYHDVTLSTPKRGQRPNSNGSGANGAAATDLSGGNGSVLSFQGTGIQYAALNLAGLQIMFDKYEAAHDSIQEAIRVAQHYGDHVCVAFALSWLLRIYRKLGKSKQQVLGLVESCMERSKELRLPSLQVLTVLTQLETELRCATGLSSSGASSATPHNLAHMFVAQAPAARPVHIWLRLQETTDSVTSLSGNASSSSMGAGGNGGRTVGNMNPQVINPQMMAARANSSPSSNNNSMLVDAVLDTVWSLSGKTCMASAAGWHIFGNRTLGHIFDTLYLQCYQDSATLCELATTVSRMALVRLQVGAKCEKTSIYEHGLNFLVDQTKKIQNQQVCSLMPQTSFQRTLHYLLYLWSMRRTEYRRAETHLNAMLSLSPMEHDLPAHLEGLLMKAMWFGEQNEFEKALSLLETVAVTCEKRGFAFLFAQVLLAKSRYQLRASLPHAPYAALNAILKCIDICGNHHYDLLLAEAHVVMAELQVAVGKAEHAIDLINDQMGLVVEHGDVYLRGECMLVLAKAVIAASEDQESNMMIGHALERLQQCKEMHYATQDIKRLREIAYLQARICNHLKNQQGLSDRAKYAQAVETHSNAFLHYQQCIHEAKYRLIEPCSTFDTLEQIAEVIDHRSMEARDIML